MKTLYSVYNYQIWDCYCGTLTQCLRHIARKLGGTLASVTADDAVRAGYSIEKVRV